MKRLNLKPQRNFVIVFLVIILTALSILLHKINPYIVDINRLKTEFVQINHSKSSKKLIFSKRKPEGWVTLAGISENTINAIVISEDWGFFDHEGIDFNQLEIVLKDAFLSGKIKRGASTISQQLVKNLFLSREKTIKRKIKEFFLTYYLEKKLRKDTILEIYFNIIEFGENLYGIQNASTFYFNKNAMDLNIKEGAFLAMLLPSPKRYSQSFRQKELTPFAKSIIISIMNKMLQAKMIDQDQYDKVINLPLNFEKISPEEEMNINPSEEDEFLESF